MRLLTLLSMLRLLLLIGIVLASGDAFPADSQEIESTTAILPVTEISQDGTQEPQADVKVSQDETAMEAQDVTALEPVKPQDETAKEPQDVTANEPQNVTANAPQNVTEKELVKPQDETIKEPYDVSVSRVVGGASRESSSSQSSSAESSEEATAPKEGSSNESKEEEEKMEESTDLPLQVDGTTIRYKDDTGSSCEVEVRSFKDGVEFVSGVPKYDLYKVLLDCNGPPGKLNATWNEEYSPLNKDSGAPERYEWYDTSVTDWTTCARQEKAFRIHTGTEKEGIIVEGQIFWKPDNFCGWFRRATYKVDITGFHPKIEFGQMCEIGVDENGQFSLDSQVSCASLPPFCPPEAHYCVAGKWVALLATLLRSD